MTRRDDSLVALATLLPLAVLLIAERRIAGAAGFPLDDAWIHLHFARNLIEGAGFSYNPGTPVAGSTAPLWTLLVAATAAIAGPSVLAVKTLGVVLTAVAGVLTRRAAAAAGAPRAIALAAGIALVWAGPVAWGALSGMEVPLAALLVAGALLAHVEDRALATAVLAALAVLARPEALLLVPLFAIARPPAIRRVMIFAAVTAVLVAPAVFFSLRTVGTAVPATAAAKVEGGLLGFLAGVREPVTLTFAARPWAFLVEWIRWLAMTQWLLPLALGPGLLLVWRRGGRALGIVALALVAHPLGMALLAPYRGPAFQEGRYSIHVLPIVLVTLAVTLGPLVTNRASVV
ncbi:MAG: hypothetical protein HY216_17905, partial [Candidatus Rokubacteria bacterium]|nr:hypothetical protein [Candidatus Rokubacteria bacterium]